MLSWSGDGAEFPGHERALDWCRVSVAGRHISSMSASLHKEEAVADGLQQNLRNLILYVRGCGGRRALAVFSSIKK